MKKPSALQKAKQEIKDQKIRINNLENQILAFKSVSRFFFELIKDEIEEVVEEHVGIAVDDLRIER